MAIRRQSAVIEEGGYSDMTDPLRVGDLVEYYADKYKLTVVGEVIELPDGHKQVKIRVLKAPYPELEGQVWYVGHLRLLKARPGARPYPGGQSDYSHALLDIRDRVLRDLRWYLRPTGYTKRPRKELYLAHDPEGVAYRVEVSPKGLVVKLTLNIKDDENRKAAYEALQAKEGAIRHALGEVRFNWTGTPPWAVLEEITWPGEDGPRPVDVDLTVERLTLYITTLQPMLGRL